MRFFCFLYKYFFSYSDTNRTSEFSKFARYSRMHGLQSDGLLSCTGIHFPICQNGGYCRGNKDCFPGNKCSGSFVRMHACMYVCMHACIYMHDDKIWFCSIFAVISTYFSQCVADPSTYKVRLFIKTFFYQQIYIYIHTYIHTFFYSIRLERVQ